VPIEISPNGIHEHITELTPPGAAAPSLTPPSLTPPSKAHATVDLPVAAEVAWTVLSDLSRLDGWLTIHDAWEDELPGEVATGVRVVQQVTIVGWTGSITWTVQDCRAPSLLRLVGTGLRDAHVTLELTIEPIGYWSRVIAEMEFSGWAVAGAAGVAMELGATRELETSLANLERLVG
jgi:hypothetical protein